MNNLIPQVRADVNGKLVTRHVKQDQSKSGLPLSAPPPQVAQQETPVEMAPALPKQQTFMIRPERLARAVKKLESANKRLERAEMEPFEWRVERREVDQVPKGASFGGLIEYVEVVDLVVDYPEVKTPTHSFMGVLTQEETGMLTRLREDVELGDWRPRESYCDHCGTNRKRNATYVVQDRETEEFSQIGSSCVEGYLGVDPSHLFSMNFNPLGDEDEELDEETVRSKTGTYISPDYRTDVRKSLALALVASHDGAEYQKRIDYWQGIPHERSESDVSTYSAVLAGLRDVDEDHKNYEWIKEMQRLATERLDDGSVDEFISKVLNDPSDNEYMENLRVLMSGERCELRNLGTLVSAVTVFHRQNKKKAEEEADAGKHRVNEWLGQPKDKLKDIKADIERVRYKETQYGTTTIITMRAESGHELTWFATNNPDVEKGDKVDIASTTIKDHSEWEGKKNTIITRTKMEVTEAVPRRGYENWDGTY